MRAVEADSAPKRKKSSKAPRGAGRDVLVGAALAEFNEKGFWGTNTNEIARRAGYAPQTFYRHFSDKADIFAAAYLLWITQERRLVAGQTRAAAVAQTLIGQHQTYRVFRRSLRVLAVEDRIVRQARTESRLAQISALLAGIKKPPSPAKAAAKLLTIERLCDAIAEGEFADLGCDQAVARRQLEEVLRTFFPH